jgi:hypothetical protein
MADREKAIEVFKRMCEATGHSELDNGDVIDRGKMTLRCKVSSDKLPQPEGHIRTHVSLFPLSCNPASLELRENRRQRTNPMERNAN